jgi:hypothetical protein
MAPYFSNTVYLKQNGIKNTDTYVATKKLKLSITCYLIWNIKPYMSISTLKITYHSLFHSIMSYGMKFLKCRKG